MNCGVKKFVTRPAPGVLWRFEGPGRGSRTHGPPDCRRSLFFVGTATTVLRLGPFTVLTDPNFLPWVLVIGVVYSAVRAVRRRR
ncbi:hypothetical protein ALI144C_07665 [Actinosynnema sp. ALI-1.44]|nr:hypothetical protein ALI144C_07665 [Actinosynnema sp. ALI-1.44]